MLTNFALLVENAVAQGGVLFPKRIECIAHSCKITRQSHLDLPAGERFQVAAEMDGDRH